MARQRAGAKPGIRERSQGHFELRAYNPATSKQIFKTYRHPIDKRLRPGVVPAEAKRELAQLVADIAAGKYGEKVEPEKVRTLGQLLDEWIDHGEARRRSPN